MNLMPIFAQDEQEDNGDDEEAQTNDVINVAIGDEETLILVQDADDITGDDSVNVEPSPIYEADLSMATQDVLDIQTGEYVAEENLATY
jgi:hypothetical protein